MVKRRWRWSWLREEGADCVGRLFSRVSCRVSFRLVFSEGEKKKRRWKGNKAIPKGKYRR